MTTRPLHDQIIQSLTRVETQVVDIYGQTVEIKEHLKALNGSVAKVATDLAVHPYECKFGVQIQEIERQLQTGDYPGSKEVEGKLDAWNVSAATAQAAKEATQKTTAKWLNALKPVFWVIGGAIVYILLTHLDALLKYYKVTP